MRGAAPMLTISSMIPTFLLTRLMRGAAHENRELRAIIEISTHAPHARRGVVEPAESLGSHEFLLTRLMRGAARTLQPDKRTQPFLLTRLMRGAAGDGRQNRAIR